MSCQKNKKKKKEREGEGQGQQQQQQEEEEEEEETEEGRVTTILTAENYRRQVEEELEKRGIIVTDEIREGHIDPIAADLC